MNIIDEDYEKVETNDVPSGYVKIEMSTNGKLGVPESVYVRNFNTGDLLNLTMYADEVIPERTIPAINNMLYGGIDVAKWPEECIDELMIKLYANYYSGVLLSVPFPWNQSDVEWLEEQGKTDQLKALKDGRYKPIVDINISEQLHTHILPKNVKDYIVIKPKNGKFELKFISYPRFGDGVAIKNYMEKTFSEADKAYAKIRNLNDIRKRASLNELIGLPEIDDDEFLQWQIYETNKAIQLAKVTQALYLVKFNGTDVSELALDAKIKLLDNPEIDINIGKILDKEYSKIKVGMIEEVKMMNPITRQPCERRLSFRRLDILEAVQLHEPTEYDIVYDD